MRSAILAGDLPAGPGRFVLVPWPTMQPRLAVVAGFVAGAIVGVALLATAVAVAPIVEPSLGPASGSVAPASPSPSPSGSSAETGPSPSAEEGEATSPSPAPSNAPSPTTSSLGQEFMVGEAAPLLVLPQLGGGTIDLASLRGRPVWLTFMATWCPSCREELPRMALAAARHAEEGLVVLAVDVGEDEGTVAAYFSSLGLSLPVGLDRDGAAMRRWRVLALPVHFWVDADGVVRFGALGGVGPDVLAEGLGTILPGGSVGP